MSSNISTGLYTTLIQLPFSLWVLGIVLTCIMLRQLLPWKVEIWKIMFAGGCAVFLSGHISERGAWNAIDWNIMGYLLGVFYVGQCLEESRYLEFQCQR